MPTWNKVIVSGAAAHLSNVTASTAVSVGTSQIIGLTQAQTRLSGSFSGSFVGDGAGLINVPANIRFSGSSGGSDTLSLQTETLAISGSNGITATVANNTITIGAPAGTVTSSAQVIALLPTGTVSSSGQVSYTGLSNIPVGIVSSSTQFTSLTAPFTGSFTGSFAGAHTGTFPYASLTGIPIGIVSSSAQVTILLPAGTVSSSTQLPTGIVSSSTQINNYNVFATTGSNTFVGNQTISGSITITQNLNVLGSSSISFVSQSTLNIGTNLITVNVQSPAVNLGGLAVIDSGSSPQRSGSLLFDSANDEWIFVHQNTAGGVTSSVVLMGPPTFNNVGNETLLTQNRVLKAGGLEHVVDSQITDDGSVVSITNSLNVGTSITASAGNITTLRATSITASVSGALSGTFPYASLTNIPVGIVSSSGQVSYTGLSNIPAGIVSSSAQFNSLAAPFTGSFTGSFRGDGSQLTGLGTNLAITGSTSGTGTIALLTQGLIVSGTNGLTSTVSGQTLTISGVDASTSVKGVASFSPSFFTAAAGAVSVSASAITPTQLNTSVAGTGLSGGGGSALSVQYGSAAGTAVQGNTAITINGTANQIAITGTAAQALGGAPSYTIGLPSSVTISTGSILGNLTIGGNLTVQGDTTIINTTNLSVEDRFILVNSGSALGGNVQGGIVVDGGTGTGAAIFYTTANSVNRWGFASSVANDASSATMTTYVAQVVDMNVPDHVSALATYEKSGNIRIDTNGDIYIWS